MDGVFGGVADAEAVVVAVAVTLDDNVGTAVSDCVSAADTEAVLDDDGVTDRLGVSEFDDVLVPPRLTVDVIDVDADGDADDVTVGAGVPLVDDVAAAVAV